MKKQNESMQRQKRMIELFAPIQQPSEKPAGATLYERGESPRGCFVVHSGEVILSLQGEGSEQILYTAASGELIGLEAVISGKTHETSARTLTACRLGFIDGEQLLAYLRANTAHCFPVLQLISDHVNTTYRSVREISASRKRPSMPN